ncbi:MAG: hypothetical protein ABW208_06625 [Pyrinomonadaceae bacterium]
MSNRRQAPIRLEGVKKVFLTDEVETHALEKSRDGTPRAAEELEVTVA